MKSWCLAAALMALGVSVSAQSLPVDAAKKTALLQEEDALRDSAFPKDSAPSDLSRELLPKFAQVRVQTADSKTAVELEAARRAYAALKLELKRKFHGRGGPNGALSKTESDARIEGEASRLLQLRLFAAQLRAAERSRVVINPLFAGIDQAKLQAYYDSQRKADSTTRPGTTGNLFDDWVRRGARTTSSVPGDLAATTKTTSAAVTLPPGAERYARVKALLMQSGRSQLEAKRKYSKAEIDRVMADRSQTIDLAVKIGLERKVDPMLVLAVIEQESQFHQYAYNKGSGCAGLMQLEAGTARDLGVRGDVYDKVANITAGTKYLEWIANTWFKMKLDLRDVAKVPQEKLKIILAAYNWGIGNVRNNLARHSGSLASLPAETWGYISQIPGRISNWFARA